MARECLCSFNLSTGEIELCELNRLSLSNVEIARIRNINQDSARTARYRLGKKLGVEPNESVEETINRL